MHQPMPSMINRSLVASLSLIVSLTVLVPSNSQAAPCFAADNDGVYDSDGLVNGVITITAASTQTVPPATDRYDCSGLGLVVGTATELQLEYDPATGQRAAIACDSMNVLAGGAVHADTQGCPSFYDGTFGSAGSVPDTAGVCTTGGAEAPAAGNDFGGAGGGGYGGMGGSGVIGTGGTIYGVSDTTPLPGGSGANTGLATGGGGRGGGVVDLLISGALTNDGRISANGGNGGGTGGRVAGGGAGGAVFISAGSLDGSTGTFEANGGDAPGTAGSGGGGRIALSYDNAGFTFDAANVITTPGAADRPGAAGTAFVFDRSTDQVRIFGGFTFDNRIYTAAQWTFDASATNINCHPGLPSDAAIGITTETLVIDGVINCAPQIESMSLIQTDVASELTINPGAVIDVFGTLTIQSMGNLNVGAGASIGNNGLGNDIIVSTTNDQTWDGVVLTGAREGRVVLDNAIALALTNATTVSGNPKWPNLVSLSLDETSVISADAKGCDARYDGTFGGPGAAPDCSNSCASGVTGAGQAGNDFGGSGGGGHGGAGGDGQVGAGGIANYESPADPSLFGASAGNTSVATGPGGAGGGAIEIKVLGAFTNNGTISADGGAGAGADIRRTGGGAGGTIRIKAASYECSSAPSYSSIGGAGAGHGGGGGGGTVLLDFATDNCTSAPVSGIDRLAVVGGGGSPEATDGQPGYLTLGSERICGDAIPDRPTGDAFTTRGISATDALMVLSTAVGSRCCSLCICDVNDSGEVTSTDALLTLQHGVGQEVTLTCPVCL